VLKSLIANGSIGQVGELLASNGTGIYWTTPPSGSLEIVSAVSSNTTLAAPTTFYIASGTITLALPTAVGNLGLRFWIKNNGTGKITVLPQSEQTINGYINMIIKEQNSVMGLVSDGSNWNIY
jgi:hypothetical protein